MPPDVDWVQCTACGKWRRLLGGAAVPAEDALWYCAENAVHWRNSCSEEEEVYASDEREWALAERRDLSKMLGGQPQDVLNLLNQPTVGAGPRWRRAGVRLVVCRTAAQPSPPPLPRRR